MLHPKLIKPESIVVVGASENIHSPGGKVLKNLLENGFKGALYGVNPKLTEVQGIPCYQNLDDLPQVDLAIIAIAAKFCVATVKQLTEEKNTRAFIIFSAGFSEQDAQGAKMEREIVTLIEKVGGSLLGPNNIGLLNTHYAGVFTTPIPKLDPQGVDFISGSGATAVFIMEAAMAKGLTFNAVYSVGNSAQIGVEEVMEHLDTTYDASTGSSIKLLYIESIEKPQKLLKHARSLRAKGCKIAAIKAGSSVAGSRAASSHTGAMANADTAVDALFKKAGIIRCYGREELIYVAGILTYSSLSGKNMAIITHAGGPAVMLTDVLSKKGLDVPKLDPTKINALREQLFPGSSVANPIDFLATGTAEQLETILDFCDTKLDGIDGMAVIFGSPGLFNVQEVYDVLDRKIKTARKPIFPILPSVVNVKEEIKAFTQNGNVAFFDEVLFGNALAKVYASKFFTEQETVENPSLKSSLQALVSTQKKGYLTPKIVKQIFDTLGINSVQEQIITHQEELESIANQVSYPVVLKVIGPVHKTDVGGVRLGITNREHFIKNALELFAIPNATGVMVQPMLSGIELYVGAKKEGAFGHTIVFGLGGVTVEIVKDIQIGLAPLSRQEILEMMPQLQAYPILEGYRGEKGIAIDQFVAIIKKVSDLVSYLPEIEELDINPLIATATSVIAVDARIRIGV